MKRVSSAWLRVGLFGGRDVLVWQQEQRDHLQHSDVAGPFELVTLKRLAMQLVGACPNANRSQLAWGLYMPNELTRSRWAFTQPTCARWRAAPTAGCGVAAPSASRRDGRRRRDEMLLVGLELVDDGLERRRVRVQPRMAGPWPYA